jgi:hypothetical protein
VKGVLDGAVGQGNLSNVGGQEERGEWSRMRPISHWVDRNESKGMDQTA